MRIPAVLLDPDLPLPSYAMPGDAALDLLAREDLTLPPGKRAAVPTGVAIALPEGYAGFVQPRSGRALHEGLGVANTPGLIDSGYRGEIKVVAVNLDTEAPVRVKRGEKIAQLVVQRVENVELEVTEQLPSSSRAEGGFGSTGR